MIFVNYGSGQYKQLQHKPWHGLTIADLVFPWFLWIMGVSLCISLNSQLSKTNSSRLKVSLKVFTRFAKLFFIGIMLNSRFGVYLTKLRIMGVLQRIAISYLFVALMEVICYSKIELPTGSKVKQALYQLKCSWKQFLITLAVILTWFLLIFFVEVPGCSLGYLGPGGLDEYGKYYNCTGGVSGYVDKLILGKDHMYANPTCKTIYKTTEPFDPEGVMGIFNSVFLVFLGVHAGRIFILYKTDLERCVFWFFWGLISFLVYGLLTGFTLESGWLPINKNLWTLSYSLITASMSFWILILLYIIIDIKKWWNGNPFIYPGMNSIIIYICHSLFATTFPVQWLVNNSHAEKIFLNLWGSCFWCLFAAYLYNKKIFFNL